MSIIFGIRKEREATVLESALNSMGNATQRYAPDGVSVYIRGRIGFGIQPFHTHSRSRLNSKIVNDSYRNVIALDGRLDNHAELRSALGIQKPDPSDSEIILACFRKWGPDCFARLIGDWALALWSEKEHALYLARDHAGTRTLYFKVAKDELRWSTYLENLVYDAPFELNRTYAARYLACLPLRDLTPYKRIEAVSSGSYFRFEDDSCSRIPHWQPLANDQLRYQTDNEYEEHFRTLFRQAVERRAAPGDPALAELSGGMDSSSIVCMSDHIRKSYGGQTLGLIDTLSFYDDSEPNWNERPYFSIIEERRGKRGIHIESCLAHRTFTAINSHEAYLVPGADETYRDFEEKIQASLTQPQHRAVLSGFGGDELLGGVPSPYPELADYAATFQIGMLFRSACQWGLAQRRPLIQILLETAKYRWRHLLPTRHGRQKTPPWLASVTEKEIDPVGGDSLSRIPLFGKLPSAVGNVQMWQSLMESLPHLFPRALLRPEYRYPYLDRDLVEFLLRIPPSQLVRPRLRRSLMRRALRGIVPNEILDRRRKAYLSRGMLVSFQQQHAQIRDIFRDSFAAQFGLIELRRLEHAFDSVITGRAPEWTMALLRTILFEIWLRDCGGKLLPPPKSVEAAEPRAQSERAKQVPCRSI
jgi:asparagine synthase (glutamine-hydrolysing)